MGQTLEPWFVELLACPQTHAPVVMDGNWLYSTDPETRRRYPVEDGIPKMLIEESEVVTEAEFSRIMQMHGIQL